jgi:opacity protein-like surface antigen
MTKIIKFALGGAWALVLASGGVAEAQGLGPWNGPYVGAHIGTAWSDTTSTTSDTVTGAVLGSGTTNTSNPNGGVQAGYDFMMSNRVVLGVVTAVSLVDSSNTTITSNPAGTIVSTNKGSTDWSGSVRARLGYAFNNTLMYGTGGWAWSTGSARRTQVAGTAGLAIPGTTETVGVDHSGWTLGGGIEYAFMPQWTVFGEYRHTEFGTESITFPVAQRLTKSTSTTEALTFGVNYKF